jgi:CHAD domain-containing protein
VPLAISPESKAQRGYRLRTGKASAFSKAPALDLSRRIGVSAAFREIVTAGLGHFLANQPAATAGDPNGLHQMRVATRRLRTALVLFKAHLDPSIASRFETELKRLGRLLGEARDWDVFCLSTLTKATDDAPGAGLEQMLRESAEKQRQAAHHRVEEELGKPALTAFLLSLAAWAEEGATHPALLGDKRMKRRLVRLAPELLDRAAKKVAKRGKHIERRSDEELHTLRKALKKLRYGVDDLAGLYGRKAVKRYLRGCTALQEQLGQMNDAAVAGTLVKQLSSNGHSDVDPAVGSLTGWSRQRKEKARRELSDAWTTFRKASPFWA